MTPPPEEAAIPRAEEPTPVGQGPSWSTAARVAWTVVGVAIVAVLAAVALAQISVVVIPLVLGLFIAAVLHPMVRWLHARRLPAALAALLCLVGLLAVLSGVFAGLAPLVMREMPELTEALVEGLGNLDRMLRTEPLGMGIRGLGDLFEEGAQQLAAGDGAAEEALSVARGLGGVVIGLVLSLVASFFYLKDGDRFARALLSLLPTRRHADARAVGQRAWDTLGGYVRGQLIVAVVDAVLIGIGLALLGVPLALPLAVLVLFGGLFPIVGAVVSGAVAVLVALADGGLTLALATVALVVAVQQLESNVVQPFVVGRVVALHPFVVIVSVTLGALTLGVFGAFIAVPAVASATRAVSYLRAAHAPDDEPEPPAALGDQPAAATAGEP